MHLQKVTGEIKLIRNIGLVVFALLFVFNLMNQIYLNECIVQRYIYTITPLIFTILLFVFGYRTIISLILLSVGALAIIYNTDPASLTGVIFFCLAYSSYRKNNFAVLILVITIVLLAIRSINLGDSIPQAIAIILGYYALYALYYFLVIKQSNKNTTVRFKTLTKEENRILEYMASGLSQKEAGFELGYDKYKTNYIVKEIRKKTGYDSLYEILYRAGLKDHSTSVHNK